MFRGRFGRAGVRWPGSSQTRHVRAINAFDEGEQLAFAFQFEHRMIAQELFHDFLIFLRLKAARAVNQDPARS